MTAKLPFRSSGTGTQRKEFRVPRFFCFSPHPIEKFREYFPLCFQVRQDRQIERGPVPFTSRTRIILAGRESDPSTLASIQQRNSENLCLSGSGGKLATKPATTSHKNYQDVQDRLAREDEYVRMADAC